MVMNKQNAGGSYFLGHLVVMHGHFWSYNKDSGHTVPSAIAENPMLHTNFMTVCFIEPQLLPMEVLHSRNRYF